jgi:hypothetical protein
MTAITEIQTPARKKTGKKAFSERKHANNEANTEAREAWLRKRTDRKASAKKRQKAAAKRTPKQRLNLLDKRLGKGCGAKKERAKLLGLIEAGSK